MLSPAKCQQLYWQQKVNCNIDVTLDDKAHALNGFIKMDYYNNSPDTLYFIWFHLWPNGYKNDLTAFSDQLLENGKTNFYFSSYDKRGYINRLDFKVNGKGAKIEDHPMDQDIVKLILPSPLAPQNTAKIETPFHVQLPFNFSRGGHVGQSYQVTQWFPKPAVYDNKGWHAMPYLDQGEFYSEFGDYEVQITLPKNYVVAATGVLQDAGEKIWLTKRTNRPVVCTNCNEPKKQQVDRKEVPSSRQMKTINFKQNDIHDFAWFADKDFIVYHDTCQLPGKILNLYSYHLPKTTEQNYWANSIQFIKNTILSRSKWLGEYPYDIVSVVEAEMGFAGGMEYPTITSVSPVTGEAALESVIEHEVGHNWNYGILASNERDHPWMDEGINTFYDNRYKIEVSQTDKSAKSNASRFITKRVPAEPGATAFNAIAAAKKDQPIETMSAEFSELNYGLIGYYKTGQWMKLLENELGRAMFDSCMHEYYRRWKFKHPYPEDFQKVMEDVSGRNLEQTFLLLSKKGKLPAAASIKKLKFETFFNLKDADKHHYVFVSPLAGYNHYDKLMLGIMIHNYTLPQEKFQFFLAPLYATGSKQLNGLGRIGYDLYPGSKGLKTELSIAGSTFTKDSFTDSANNITYQRFSKLVPSVRIVFANKYPRSHMLKFLQWKTFFIREKGVLFTRDTINNIDIISFPSKSRYVNQLRFVVDNNRVLYPYHAEMQLEQGKDFARLAFTGNYFFNYEKDGGMNVRLFAGKFFYLGDKTSIKQYETDRYHLNMTGPKGDEDYTYSDYFIGRNEFEKFPSQQIMQRDGFFKVRTDYLSNKIGKTDNWLAAANFTTDIPQKYNPLQVLPFKIPLKVFADAGTYAEAWQPDAATGKFIFDAGLQLSLFRNALNIYIPLFYSKVYRDYFKSTIIEKRFWKNISFSIDIQNITLRKLAPQIPSY